MGRAELSGVEMKSFDKRPPCFDLHAHSIGHHHLFASSGRERGIWLKRTASRFRSVRRTIATALIED
jgi:hypothetical protein